MKQLLFFVIFCMYCAFPFSALADGIISITPASGNAGETVNATIVLDENAVPSLPPAGEQPDAVAIGDIGATSYNRTSLTTVVATFDIPGSTISGNYDVSVTFTPGGNPVIYTLADGFEVFGAPLPVYYVDGTGGNDANNGLSWSNAKQTIQAAIDEAATAGAGEVWVKAGTYYPTSGTDRTVSFTVKANVALYGGFNGTESNLTERNVATNTTLLSGDIGTPGDASDNSYHVLVTESEARIDGFSITGGQADGDRIYRMGGGVYLADNQAYIENNTFYGNYAEEGAAAYVFNINGDGSGTTHNIAITNCSFENNTANIGGALVLRVGASSTIENCSFQNNTAEWRGGAIFIDYGAYDTNPISILNCTFNGNSTNGNGGAIYSDDMASQLQGTYWNVTNCTFTSNTAAYRGGAIANYNSNNFPTISGNEFTSNTATLGGNAIANDYGVTLSVSGNTLNTGQDIDLDAESTCSGTDCP